jgi:hypothetical protein
MSLHFCAHCGNSIPSNLDPLRSFYCSLSCKAAAAYLRRKRRDLSNRPSGDTFLDRLERRYPKAPTLKDL